MSPFRRPATAREHPSPAFRGVGRRARLLGSGVRGLVPGPLRCRGTSPLRFLLERRSSSCSVRASWPRRRRWPCSSPPRWRPPSPRSTSSTAATRRSDSASATSSARCRASSTSSRARSQLDDKNWANSSVDGHDRRDPHRHQQREARRPPQSPDFFDVAKYPTLTFKSTKVTSAGKGKLQVAGDLTIRDVTKPVVIDVDILGSGQIAIQGNTMTRAGFEATHARSTARTTASCGTARSIRAARCSATTSTSSSSWKP